MADVDAKIEQDYKVGEGPKALSEKYGVPVNTNTPKKGYTRIRVSLLYYFRPRLVVIDSSTSDAAGVQALLAAHKVHVREYLMCWRASTTKSSKP